MEEIAQLFVDVRDAGGHDPPRGEQQRRKGEWVSGVWWWEGCAQPQLS